MAKPFAPKTLKVMEYFRKNPDAPASVVTRKFNMAISTVYQLRAKVRAEESKPEARKKIIVSADQMAVAAKLGLSAEDFIKGGVEGGFLKYADEPVTEPSNVDAILGERGNRYGTFESNAKTCQLLKNVLHSQDGWYRLSYVQREAVEMIMHKISRLVNGDSTYLDTVVDIAGYNQLMLEHMRDQNEGKKVE